MGFLFIGNGCHLTSRSQSILIFCQIAGEQTGDRKSLVFFDPKYTNIPYPMTDPYVCHIWFAIYHQYTPVMLVHIPYIRIRHGYHPSTFLVKNSGFWWCDVLWCPDIPWQDIPYDRENEENGAPFKKDTLESISHVTWIYIYICIHIIYIYIFEICPKTSS